MNCIVFQWISSSLGIIWFLWHVAHIMRISLDLEINELINEDCHNVNGDACDTTMCPIALCSTAFEIRKVNY